MEHPVAQGSEAWLLLRQGRPTASEFDSLVTPEFVPRKGQTPETYLYRKLAEVFAGVSTDTVNSWAMDQGAILESEAIPWFEFQYDVKVRRVGFVTTDDMKVGCSPDGLIGEDGGIEVKCPQAHTHLQYLMEGRVPKEYLAQVHGCMFVTGRSWWNFISYHRKFPPLVVRVERDETIQAVLAQVLAAFVAKFEAALAKVDSMQPPSRRRRKA
jgi:hypothetical protein